MPPIGLTSRRRILLGLALAAVGTVGTLSSACKAGGAGAAAEASEGGRCEFCGMKIDPASAFATDLVVAGKTLHFDSAKCAFNAWRQKKLAVQSSRFQEFYTRVPTDAANLVFARGSDVLGPMGTELVPLDPASAARFTADHGAKQTYKVEAITADLLRTL